MTTSYPGSFVDPNTGGKRSNWALHRKKKGNWKITTYFHQEKHRKCNINLNTKDTPNEPISIQSMGGEENQCWNLTTWANENDRTNLHSVAYASGFGYHSFFTFANQVPRSVSNTALQKEAKNSLNTPRPSIHALGKKKRNEIRKPKSREYERDTKKTRCTSPAKTDQ